MKEYNKYTIVCPDENVLIEFQNNKLDGSEKQLVAEHLSLCNTCPIDLDYLSKDLPGKQTEDSSQFEMSPKLKEAVNKYNQSKTARQNLVSQPLSIVLQDSSLKVGQIWQTNRNVIFPTENGIETLSVSQLGSVSHLVVITEINDEVVYKNSSFGFINVMPINGNTNHARESELIFLPNETKLGYEFLIQIWNEQEMLVQNLDLMLCEIDNFSEKLNEFTVFREPYSMFDFVRNGEYFDPILRYRAMEVENTAYLRQPALNLHSLVDVELNTVQPSIENDKNWLAEIKNQWEVVKHIISIPAYAKSDETTISGFKPYGKSGMLYQHNQDELRFVLETRDFDSYQNTFILGELNGNDFIVPFYKFYDTLRADINLEKYADWKFFKTPFSISDINNLSDEQAEIIFKTSINLGKSKKTFDIWTGLMENKIINQEKRNILKKSIEDFEKMRT